MVGISSGDVYRAYEVFHNFFSNFAAGRLEPTPLDENTPYRRKLYPYRYLNDPSLIDYDKIPVEKLYRNAFEERNTILRLAAVHGPGYNQLRLKEPISRILDKRRMILNEEN